MGQVNEVLQESQRGEEEIRQPIHFSVNFSSIFFFS